MDSESVPELKLISLISQLLSLQDSREPNSDCDSNPGSRFISLTIQIISLVSSIDFYSQSKPESKLMSLVSQTITLFNSMDFDSLPKPLSKLTSLTSQKISLGNSKDLGFNWKFHSLLEKSMKLEPEPELMSLIHQVLSLVFSMNNSKWEKLISLSPQIQVRFEERKSRFHINEEKVEEQASNNKWDCLPLSWRKFRFTGEEYTHFLCKGCNGKNHKEYEEAPVEIKHRLHPKHSLQLVLLSYERKTRDCCCCRQDLKEVFYYCSPCDFAMNVACVEKPQVLYDLESESTLISLITQLIIDLEDTLDPDSEFEPEFISLITKIITRVSSLNLASQPKPESKLVSLVKETSILFNSMNLYSLPQPLSDLISIITQLVNSKDLDSKLFKTVILQTLELKPEPKLLSFIHQILSHVSSMNPEWEKLISVSPQVIVELKNGKFHVDEGEDLRWSNNKWGCLPEKGETFRLTRGADMTHVRCQNCNGEYHEEYEKAPVEIKHDLHPKHSLQLVLWKNKDWTTRRCYCCDENLKEVFYSCFPCDFGMNIACVVKPPVLSVDHPKWHDHTLALFPTQASFPCNLCALTRSRSCPFYICPPCDFVVHTSCLSLPRVIRISRHPHRISFTHSFQKGDWFCGVCRKKVDNDYGGYSCIKNGCSYAAHSKCATQRNVWDGIDLEGVPEEIEEEVEPPFVEISHGIIQHFSHEHHHLRLDHENMERDFDEDKLCHACITPIYFGNSYSCVECEYILHETCANLSRKIHSPIHPHMLNLVERNINAINSTDWCSACPYYRIAGFFYECGKEECVFQLHVQCVTLSEPLVHGSHIHPLFLTSKPGERRKCSVCQVISNHETFNCIEPECNFSLCFTCATIPEKVRYKHDKHVLTLSYGDQEMKWCEACERKIEPKDRFYKCGEYCCVTLHIECLIGNELYMKPGSCWFYKDKKISVMPNNQHMSRPFCSFCKKRCPYKIVFQKIGSILCSVMCVAKSRYN